MQVGTKATKRGGIGGNGMIVCDESNWEERQV